MNSKPMQDGGIHKIARGMTAKDYGKAYNEANKEKIKAKKKEYYEDNKEQISARGKAYREANKEKERARCKAYYEANKEKLYKKVTCECGSLVSQIKLTRHKKTKKHKAFMESK